MIHPSRHTAASDSSPLLTMVVPVLNRRNHIVRLLARVVESLSVCSRPFSLVVVDNGSTDGTAHAVQEWVRVTGPSFPGAQLSLLHEPRPGASPARNRGLSAVTTPWVMFFDSDDDFSPTLPDLIAHCISVNGDADLIGWEVTTADGHDMVPTHRCCERGHHLFHASLATQRYAVRTDVARLAGGWNESLPVWNDLEFGVRLLGQHPRMVMLPGNVRPVKILVHNDSITGSLFSDRPGQRELSLNAIEDFYRHSGQSDMLPMVDARRLILADRYRREGATDAATALTRRVWAKSRPVHRQIALHIVAMVQHILGRGGSAAALRLL